MHPEIARRCESCGAAIRVHAIFCPQCGVPLRREEQKQRGGNSVEVPEAKLRELYDLLKTQKITPAETISEEMNQKSNITPPEAPRVEVARGDDGSKMAEPTVTDVAAPAVSGSEADAGRKRQRMAAARGAVQENLRPRVERLKQTSAVVLDEAAEDPSLRFVLIALALIVISLVLLLLSLVR